MFFNSCLRQPRNREGEKYKIPTAAFSIQLVCFYRPQRSCGQGNIFTPVCHSVHGGGSPLGRMPPQTRQTPLGADTTPPDQADPPPGADTTHPDQADPPSGPGRPPLGTDTTPPEQTPSPQEQTPPPPRTRQIPPPEQTPPPPRPRQTPSPPGKQTSAYGQRAAGTHPTGMHSCSTSLLFSLTGVWPPGLPLRFYLLIFQTKGVKENNFSNI